MHIQNITFFPAMQVLRFVTPAMTALIDKLKGAMTSLCDGIQNALR